MARSAGLGEAARDLQKAELITKAIGEKVENLLVIGIKRMVLSEVQFVEVRRQFGVDGQVTVFRETAQPNGPRRQHSGNVFGNDEEASRDREDRRHGIHADAPAKVQKLLDLRRQQQQGDAGVRAMPAQQMKRDAHRHDSALHR